MSLKTRSAIQCLFMSAPTITTQKNIQKPILLFQAHLHEIILILCAVYFWAMLMVVQ